MKRSKQEVLTRRLKTTALAAGAVVGCTGAAHAAVIGGVVNETVNKGETFDLDLDQDGRNDFRFLAGEAFSSTAETGTSGPEDFALIAGYAVGAGTATGTFGSFGGSSFGGGVVVSSGPFSSGTETGTGTGTFGTSFGARVFEGSELVDPGGFSSLAPFAPLSLSGAGPFVGDTPRFVGLVFNTTDYDIVTGWVRVSVPSNSTIYIQDYAFETDERPIHIPNEVPEPSTLLLMASGAAGLLALRRRRKS